MPLSDIVNLTITAQTQTVSQQGFNTGILMAYHTAHMDLTRSYSNLAAVAEDHAAGTVIYRAAQAFFAQSPRPSTLKIGRRATAMSQTYKLTPTNTTEDFVYTLEFIEPDGTVQTATYTVQAGDTVATVIDGLKIAIDALGMDVTTTDNMTDLDFDADNAGDLFSIEDKSNSGRPGSVKIKNTTADPGIAADLTAIAAMDPDFFGIFLDSNSEAEGLAAMAWVETSIYVMSVDSSDTEILDQAISNDYFSDAETSAYARSFGVWKSKSLSFAGGAALGRMLPFTPGEFDIFLKTLAGQAADNLSDTHVAQIKAKTGNYYNALGGVNVYREGKTFANEWIDVIILIEYLRARIKENIFVAMLNQNKVPYTDSGVSLLVGVLEGTLRERESTPKRAKGLRPGTILVDAPAVASVPAATRNLRKLPDVTFQAEIEGSIHSVDPLTGVLSP